LQDGKLKAKKESRPIKTGQGGEYDVKTACQQACPTNAIEFGNVNDQNSTIYRQRADHQQRLFYSLEMIHTLPNVSYLAKVRNTDNILPFGRGHEENTTTVGGEPQKDLKEKTH
jgi:molybdopterin-containing oxidoreductase family iron-sulfur binding subunit